MLTCSAADIRRAGASNAGAQYGNAAVAAIVPGISSLNINVNANVTSVSRSADTGSQAGGGARGPGLTVAVTSVPMDRAAATVH
jgi:hypothetical protein